MDVNCAAPGADDKSSEEFSFEVPITNLKLESRNMVDVLYVMNAVSADIEALDCEITNTITNKDVNKTPAKKIEVLKEAKSADDADSVNAIVIVHDDDAKNRNEEPKERESSKILDNTEKTKNSITDVPKKVQKDEKKPETTIVLDDISSNSVNSVKDIKETDKSITIHLDDIESDNVTVFKGNKSDSDVIVLDVNKTNSDVVVLDGNKTDSETTIIYDDELTTKYPTHPIVIDEDKDNDCSIVEASSTKSNRHNLTEYDKLFRENSLLSELIEKCFDMENTEGMSRVINRTLLAIYKDLDETYKKSDGFSKVLKKTIMCLDVYPNRKFCHLKNLCDELKSHKAKKRVPFITLKRADKDKGSTSCKPTKKKRVEVVIDLDDENNDVNKQNVPTQAKNVVELVQIDDSSSDDNDVIMMDKHYNSNKENGRKTNKKAKTPKKRGRPRKDRSNGIQNHLIHKSATNRNHSITEQDIVAMSHISHTSNAEKQFDTTHKNQYVINPSTIDSGSLLEPRQTTNLDMDEINQHKIRNIETHIAFLQSRIELLEESEVIADNHMSPYVISEDLKGTVVKLYNELCQITGTEATKRHEVRLQVVAGHPEGPVRCLEEFLNANIDEAGNPPFPDVQDVIQCVCLANVRYNLQWTHDQIVNEAAVLFVQFGRSMQKRRQLREFKSLIRLVKEERPDPADDDPVLQARLIENTRIANRNEQELLERFVNLERGFARRSKPQLRLSIDQSEDSDDDSDVDPHPDDEGPAKATGTSTAEEISEPPIPPNALRTDNIPPTFNVIETIGSSVTVSNGSIVIEPIKYGLLEPQEAKNVKSSEFSPFLTEFQRYIYNSRNKYSVHNKLVKEKANSVHNFVKTTNIENTNNIQNTKVDFENATNLAKEILSLVQTDLSTENKAEEDINLNRNQYTTIERLNPIVKLTNLNQNTLINTKECSSVKVNISNHELKQNNKTGTENGFIMFTHTTMCENANKHCNRQITDRNKTNLTENKCASEETNQIETSLNKNVDSNMDDVNDIVKPEPLDIPSMLNDLGQGFTATIFDIEDPFLVIEISDSSESEDDDL